MARRPRVRRPATLAAGALLLLGAAGCDDSTSPPLTLDERANGQIPATGVTLVEARNPLGPLAIDGEAVGPVIRWFLDKHVTAPTVAEVRDGLASLDVTTDESGQTLTVHVTQPPPSATVTYDADLSLGVPAATAAQNNFWRIAGGGDIAPEDTLEIRSRIDTETSDPTAPNRVDISGPSVTGQIPGYAPCHPEDPGPGIALGSSGQSAPSGEEHGNGAGSEVGTDAASEAPSRITRTEVGDAVPVPTRGSVTLTLRVRFGGVEDVAVDAFDVRGRRVREVLRTRLGSGEYRLVWDGRDTDGKRVGAGAHFLRVRVGDLVDTRKVLVLR